MNSTCLSPREGEREKEGRKESFSPSFRCPSLPFCECHTSHVTKTLSVFPFFRVHFPFFIFSTCASRIGTCRIHAYLITDILSIYCNKWILRSLEGLQKSERFCKKRKSNFGKKFNHWKWKARIKVSTRKAGTADKLEKRKGKTRKLANVVRESWGSRKGTVRKDTMNN